MQIFTEPFYQETTVLVGLKARDFNIQKPDDLRGLRIAIIDGFGYEKMSYFGSVITVPNFDHLIRLILRDRVDAAVIGEPEFIWQNKLVGEKLTKIFDMEHYDLQYRVHKSKKEIIPQLNATIVRLRQCGAIERMLEGMQSAPLALNHQACSQTDQ